LERPTNEKHSSIVQRCFWIQIKFITDDSKAMHSIITTILLKLNEVILIRKVFTTEEEAPSKLGLGLEKTES
jgi:hypothetical protein